MPRWHVTFAAYHVNEYSILLITMSLVILVCTVTFMCSEDNGSTCNGGIGILQIIICKIGNTTWNTKKELLQMPLLVASTCWHMIGGQTCVVENQPDDRGWMVTSFITYSGILSCTTCIEVFYSNLVCLLEWSKSV